MTSPQQLRASGARRESAKTLRGAECANVARDWPSILADAKARGVANCDLADELGLTPMATSKQAARHGVVLPRKHGGGRRFHSGHKPKFRCPEEWGLTPQQAQLMAVLVDAEGEVSLTDIYDYVMTSGDTDPKIIDVVLCNTRRKLRPFNIYIHRYYARGIFLDPIQRKRLRAGAVTLKPSERTP